MLQVADLDMSESDRGDKKLAMSGQVPGCSLGEDNLRRTFMTCHSCVLQVNFHKELRQNRAFTMIWYSLI